jgi:hypothetical protein
VRRLLSARVAQLRLLLQRLLLLQQSALTAQTALKRLQHLHLHSNSKTKDKESTIGLTDGGFFIHTSLYPQQLSYHPTR